MKSYACKSKKHKKPMNEDLCFVLSKGDIAVYTVLDGISSSNGKMSVKVAKKAMLPWLKKLIKHEWDGSPEEGIMGLLSAAIKAADSDLRSMCMSSPKGQSYGTTVSCAVVYQDTVITANIGDSPIFQIDYAVQSIKPLFRDENMAGKLVEEGKMSEEEALDSDEKYCLLRWVGSGKADSTPISIHSTAFTEDQLLLIGSDGAFPTYTTDLLLDDIYPLQGYSPSRIIRFMWKKAKNSTSRDNFTLIAIRKK